MASTIEHNAIMSVDTDVLVPLHTLPAGLIVNFAGAYYVTSTVPINVVGLETVGVSLEHPGWISKTCKVRVVHKGTLITLKTGG